MTCGCGDLLKAIDAYIAKKEEDLAATLSEAGFVNSAETVKNIASLEDQLTKALIEETEYLLDVAGRAEDLTTFASLWDGIKRNDKMGQTTRQIFLNQFSVLIPRLTVSYLAETDLDLAVASGTKGANTSAPRITKRTTAWTLEWSEELGEIMELGSHKEIEKILMDGLKKGDGIAEFTRAIQESGIRNEYYRARRVALTETLRAHSVAQQEAFTQNPAVEEKEWRHTGSYRNSPRENHVDMDGKHVPVDETFMLEGRDGVTYYPMFPRDSSLPPGESVNCHCICQPIVSKEVLGLSIEERRRLQQEAIDADDGKWEQELGAKNRAKAGVEESIYKPDETAYNKIRKDVQENYNPALNQGAQDKHIVGTNNYMEGRSILTADPVELLSLYQGNGELKISTKGDWTKKEAFRHTEEIGIWKDQQGREAPTKNGIIHHAKKKGVHIVPAKPRKGD